MQVPCSAPSVAAVRAALVAELRRRHVPDEVVDDAALVASELVGNAVRHGRPLASGALDVRWSLHRDVVHLEVRDGGSGAVLPARRTVGPQAESGRGLAIVDALAARWGSTALAGTNVVWADVPLAARPSRVLQDA